ncbi:MAG TPA: hypothetical protein VGM82_23435 [Gemmatimonadaceae bacterium]|jgi:metal-responsive CopG/Arc/MetJ family transcriptional regulator
MKTAISLPDELFSAADVLASRLGLSRSGLIAAALTEYIARHKTAKISERLDAVYGTEDSGIDPSIAAAQRRAIRHDTEW